MTRTTGVWGVGPTARYAGLAARFRPLFERIRQGAVQRELERRLPVEQLGWLKEAGFGAVLLPEEVGGAGATIAEFFELLAELAQADSNLPQALRVHFQSVENVLVAPGSNWRDRWIARLAKGETIGSAWTEVNTGAKAGTFATRVVRDGEGWRLNGTKYYTTGSIFADWINVGAVDEADEHVSVHVPTRASGVSIVDDWDGFGQTLTGSGTASFVDVPVAGEEIRPAGETFGYSAAWLQVNHLATLVGIVRAAAEEVAEAVAERQRTYTHGAADRASRDPQVLQVVGRVHSQAYAAGGILQHAVRALQRCRDATLKGEPEASEAANIRAEIEIAQAQTTIASLVLDATTQAFDALGASATLRSKGLDRHWRNARTVSSHNPLIYKERIVGDYAVNRTPPPFQWHIGQA
ncbi:MAG TPA: acyl-CoA dehydrogenase family protein [Geminicoccus sp.]|uniref:acyl-CoA dehydrogenase family protein n=1 Tax=Geminicoccus sp. TaxID=2024832 RepID=UPI002BCC2E93|nr:acyl-CoA dehydrogenase family protein [Geminicoccus sp.]HWL71937.1 acyl-CoA dehydrogenase family protein [Geminicoccus sp.]